MDLKFCCKQHDAYRFIQLTKAECIDIRAPLERKGMTKSTKKDIHYRRAIVMRMVISTMEVIQKKGFRTYTRTGIFSPIMTSPAKVTPDAASNVIK